MADIADFFFGLHGSHALSYFSLIRAPQNFEVLLSWLVVLLIFVLVISVVVLYFAREREHRRLLESEASVGDIETQLASFRSQMSPHFLFNSLNAIQYYIDRSEVEKSEFYLTKFSMMIRMFLQYSKNPTVSVDSESRLLENYLFLEQFRFDGNLEFSVEVSSDLDRFGVYIPSMLVQPIVAQIVNQQIFESAEPCRLLVSFSNHDDLHIEIEIAHNATVGKYSETIFKTDDDSKDSAIIQQRMEFLNRKIPKSVTYHTGEIYADEGLRGTSTRLILLKFDKEDSYNFLASISLIFYFFCWILGLSQL